MAKRERAFRTRGVALLALGSTLSLVFVYLAVRKVDFHRFWDALVHCDYWWLVPSLAVLAITIAIRGVRWRLLFLPSRRPPLGPVLGAMMIGYLLNTVLPARAGEAGRIVALSRRTGASRVETLGTVIAERAYDVAGLFVLLFAAYPFLPSGGWTRRATLFGLAFVLAAAIGIGLLAYFRERAVRVVLRPFGLLPRVSEDRLDAAVGRLHDGLAGFVQPRLALLPFTLTVVSWLLLALSFWALMAAFHLHVGFAAAVLVAVVTNLAMLVPAAPAALGVFEAATVYALAGFGVEASPALSYAVVLHAVNVFPVAAVGYVALQRQALGLGRTEGLRTRPEAGGRGVSGRVEEEAVVGERGG